MITMHFSRWFGGPKHKFLHFFGMVGGLKPLKKPILKKYSNTSSAHTSK
jgi:hypothetical protein